MNHFNDQDLIFDYIVIGTGPAGSVISKTLSDDFNISVLVLEAGDNNNEDVPIRTQSPETWINFPQYFWQGSTIAQPYANARMFPWSTGRILGGGSSVNGGQYARPSVPELLKWERLLGPPWSPAHATESFRHLETFNGLTTNLDARGYEGRLNIIQTPQEIPSLTRKLVDAMEQATGYPIILDYNDPNTPIGPFYRWQLYQQPDRSRESGATAFFSEDIMTPEGVGVNGRNLRVFYRSTALRIIFNHNRDAIGVEFLKEGKKYTAYVRRKVIISAGINSAQLLMLSGIGPGQNLIEAGIPVLFDNPHVGTNLANHTINTAIFTVNQEDLPELLEEPYALYSGGAFLPNPLNLPNLDREVQLIGYVTRGVLMFFLMHLLPKSRGTIQIQNNDPLKIVIPDEGFLSNPEDMTVMKSIFRTYLASIARQLSEIDPSYQLISPNYEVINDDTLLENFIREDLNVTYHQQCQLRMAPLNEGGVVDQYGRVYGVNNLIVADSSIFPFITDANNSAAAYYVGYTIARQLLIEHASANSFSSYTPWFYGYGHQQDQSKYI